VLFGLLMIRSPANQAVILAALPSASSNVHVKEKIEREKDTKRAKLATLVEQAKEFAVFYTVVSKHMGGEKESKVAREVVGFLEAQRDSVVIS
jgi:FixJ family two-component response regulator